jgi:Bacteriophage HK97-gp10, putative tail-component
MSHNHWEFDGLEELKRALRDLPESLAGEATGIVNASANAAAREIEQAYPRRTGNLRNHVSVSHQQGGRVSAAAIVKNTAKHAWIFENGTQARHTDLGANRGSMPPGHVFVPRVIRHRRQMYEALKELLVKHGLIVSGDAT